MAFFLGVETWKVPTNGPSAAEQANKDNEGIAGSCKCRRSKSPLAIHCFARELAIGPNKTRATEPLTGMEIGLPALLHNLHASLNHLKWVLGLKQSVLLQLNALQDLEYGFELPRVYPTRKGKPFLF